MNIITTLVLCFLVITGCNRFFESSGPLGKNKEWCDKHLGEPVDRSGLEFFYLVNGIKVRLIFNEKGQVENITYFHDSSLIPIPLTETEIQGFLRDNSDGKHWQLHTAEELRKNNEESLAQNKLDRERYAKENEATPSKDLADCIKNLDELIASREKQGTHPYFSREWTRKGAKAFCDVNGVTLSVSATFY